ncbi:MAG: methyl-accepting chemotaxis protein, partial [Lachnospiraceae bacterium]|nr:methyl-accepting chemotaxis protein [Lachnospiraceae bacterium]
MREERNTKIVSIKVKLLGIILPVVIVIMILLVGILYFISKDIIKEYSENLLTSSIDNQTNQIEAWLNENLSAFG